MMLEPLLLFETVLIENRPVHQLIDSDFSYRSGPLSNWYKTGKRTGGLPPTRLAYKRESLASRREGGVITNAAVMTMTSNPVRSQPITRGAWMLTVIFNNPPEPPPANVPPAAGARVDDRRRVARGRRPALPVQGTHHSRRIEALLQMVKLTSRFTGPPARARPVRKPRDDRGGREGAFE